MVKEGLRAKNCRIFRIYTATKDPKMHNLQGRWEIFGILMGNQNCLYYDSNILQKTKKTKSSNMWKNGCSKSQGPSWQKV